jgi:hypothetical protein
MTPTQPVMEFLHKAHAWECIDAGNSCPRQSARLLLIIIIPNTAANQRPAGNNVAVSIFNVIIKLTTQTITAFLVGLEGSFPVSLLACPVAVIGLAAITAKLHVPPELNFMAVIAHSEVHPKVVDNVLRLHQIHYLDLRAPMVFHPVEQVAFSTAVISVAAPPMAWSKVIGPPNHASRAHTRHITVRSVNGSSMDVYTQKQQAKNKKTN